MAETIGIVLTWRYCRYEGALRDRSLDLKEATAITRYTIVQDGTQGMYHYPRFLTRPLCYIVLFALALSPSLSSPPLLVGSLPCSSDLDNRQVGEAGKGYHSCISAACKFRRLSHARNANALFISFIDGPWCRDRLNRAPCITHLSPCTTLASTLRNLPALIRWTGQQCDYCGKR